MKKKNPIIGGCGVCDPHIHIFEEKAYLFASHDRAKDNNTWLMDDWQIWSSENLTSWQYESTVRPEEMYIGACDRCWAVDAAEKGGKYYYYFSNGNKEVGVAAAEHPYGPYRDMLGGPLLDENLTESRQYDPTVFVDPDDAKAYLIWGCTQGNGYYIAQLQENMISLAEKPRSILIDGKPARDDKSFLHKKNGIYYLSWGSFYAMSDCIYGPYRYGGSLGISEDHGSFFSWNGQDFCAFTIFDPSNYFRATGLCYIHYKDDGTMMADQMIAEYGVGQYDSNWNKIRPEWFMSGKNVRKVESFWGGFDIAGITEESELYYPNIYGTGDKKKIHFLVASKAENARIEMWDDKLKKKIGECPIKNTGGYENCGYQVFSCALNILIGEEKINLRLRFRDCGRDLIRIHWFRFT